jgi:hypothetical protein
MDTNILIAGGAAVVVSLTVGYFAGATIRDIRAQRLDLIKRVEELEQVAAGKRHTHSVNAALEDMAALAMRLLVEEDTQSEFRRAWIRQLGNIFGVARTGPNAYDPERESGVKVPHKVE